MNKKEAPETVELLTEDEIDRISVGIGKMLGTGIQEQERRIAMSKKNLPVVISAEENEALFLAALNAKAEANRTVAELQRALVHSEMTSAKEKRAARREMDGLVGFVGVVALLIVTFVCVLAAPVWTACLPLAGMLAVMRKARWI